MSQYEEAAFKALMKDNERLKAELAQMTDSKNWYKHRVDLMQKHQSEMRDPERVIVCDILANGMLLEPSGDRYALRAQEPTIPEGFVLVPKGLDPWMNTNGAVNKMLADKQKYDPAMLRSQPAPSEAKDAARLEWLIKSNAIVLKDETGNFLYWHTSHRRTEGYPSPRESIDAAMQKEQP